MNPKIAGLACAALSILVIAGVALGQINPGTKLTGSINVELNSKDARVGQTFLLTGVHTSNFDVNGATVYGHVSHVQRAGQGTPGKIDLAVDKINTKAGNIYRLEGQVVNVEINTKSNAGKEALAAAGGGLVTGLLTKNAFWGLVGAAGGYLVAKNSRENITIPRGSLVTVRVSSATRVNQ
jgi:hypothetical protein